MLVAVILTVQLQIKPTAEQKLALEATMRTCNAAADWISERGFATGAFSRLTLHARFYKDVRELFNISAQAACRIFAKVADA